ncbi:MAG: HNH endonuclease [Gemmatimonadetes bacterium]|nr:HNH endonuclease [Gemmatimonadota bacterium]
MRFWTGVTDNRWYDFLSRRPHLDEVNFWHPGGSAPFNTLPPGTPFLFKLKAPHHHLAGGAFFVKFESLPLRLAWDAFGEKNGAATFEEFAALIMGARGRAGPTADIGCSILSEPFFFPRDAWIPVAEQFSRNIVTGKSFDTATEEGRALWSEIDLTIARLRVGPSVVAENPVRFGEPAFVRPRLGQGAFRALVTNAYGRRCAITGESTLPVLEAAHIKPVAESGPNDTRNGLLLRSDFHRLFDLGLVTVDVSHRVVVSARIKEQWFNGKAYNSLHGAALKSLPEHPDDRPLPEYLRWHNESIFERVA